MSIPFCSSPSTSESGSSYEKGALLDDITGTQKVRYHPDEDWDFIIEATKPVDLSLLLPHYRARNQPIEHRMNMFVSSDSGPIKVKVCRTTPRTHFYLEVQSQSTDITLYLPSDFKGHIRHSSAGHVSFSAGFTNRIMRNVRLNERVYEEDEYSEDEVVVQGNGRVVFKMWDVNTCAPESRGKETLKRVFSTTRKSAATRDKTIDWDFLLED